MWRVRTNSKGHKNNDIGIQKYNCRFLPSSINNNNNNSLLESRAIARYIDKVKGGKLIHFEKNAIYGLVEAWISIEAGNFSKFTEGLILFFKTLLLFNYPIITFFVLFLYF